jgi:hypothetical protein
MNCGVAREHDDFHERVFFLDYFKRFNAVEIRHFDIEENNVNGVVLFQPIQRLHPGKSTIHRKPPLTQASGDSFNKRLFIIDRKDIERGHMPLQLLNRKTCSDFLS